jgi:hypothetical protein
VHLCQHTTGVSNIVGANDIASASDVVGTNAFPLADILPGANITLGTSGSAGANFTSGVSGSIGGIQAISATYPRTPRDNLRMLEIRSNLGAFTPDPPVSETGLCGSNTVAMWRRRYKQ